MDIGDTIGWCLRLPTDRTYITRRPWGSRDVVCSRSPTTLRQRRKTVEFRDGITAVESSNVPVRVVLNLYQRVVDLLDAVADLVHLSLEIRCLAAQYGESSCRKDANAEPRSGDYRKRQLRCSAIDPEAGYAVTGRRN